ncbi:MAG: hypothetical protein PUB49_07345, partial [Selenomonadaceae bacterium]|nr:hypothetical protein [Selenomonadaceae bacterium]
SKKFLPAFSLEKQFRPSEARLTVFPLLIKRQKFLVAGCHRWSVGTGAPAAGDLLRTRTH